MEISKLEIVLWIVFLAMIVVFFIVNIRARQRGTGGGMSDDV